MAEPSPAHSLTSIKPWDQDSVGLSGECQHFTDSPSAVRVGRWELLWAEEGDGVWAGVVHLLGGDGGRTALECQVCQD